MNEELKGYPKYQYSVFLKNGRDEQIVIRADDFKEFMELKKNIDVILSKTGTVSTSPAQGLTTTPEEPAHKLCGIHGTPMKMKPAGISKKTGKPYNAFWSCPTQNADGSYCNYRPS